MPSRKRFLLACSPGYPTSFGCAIARLVGLSVRKAARCTPSWKGHRLDRDFSARWTKYALAMEEATAELTASFLLADLGIAHEPRPDPAAYLASWLGSEERRVGEAGCRQ